ncbi:fibronectin-attachment protein (FAP) [Methylobacterium sp. J-070]|uniref:fibronectin-attachment protein (FAP) n=1 Tax=Methylobacterium sp. J-070 TaxID=2836650 RepID=UPI001FB96485|nr:fibronectin-attachment protein (FAP) [Methylobacterium sp. J-070]MCJ2051044.1 fibronectin-attachment protein (FAP) [Methylobacterium sp. J-070]
MSRGIETDALTEPTEADQPRTTSAPAHPVTGEPAALDRNDPNPPAPPRPQPQSQTDSGFGSFG